MNYYDFSVEYNGKTYSGRYRVSNKMLYVTSAYGDKSTQIGSLNAEFLAKRLLRELLQSNASRQDT